MTTTQDDEPQDRPGPPAWGAPDSYLVGFVSAVNSAADVDFSIYLTLTIPSGMLNGELISGSRWWDELADTMQQVSTLPADERGFAAMFRERAAREQEEDAATAGPTLPTLYIHLRDARVYTPGQPGLPGNGMLWRGRLSEITGWGFGRFGEPEES